MNKQELLTNLENQREAFLDIIDNLTEEELTTPGVIGQWSIKDILTHLSRWEAEMVKLLWQVSQGEKPSSMHFTMKGTLDQVNAAWYKESATRDLVRVMDDFQAVRNQTVLRVEGFTDRDLTDPKRFPALQGMALWEYIEGDSFGHEAEHMVDIQNWLDKRKVT